MKNKRNKTQLRDLRQSVTHFLRQHSLVICVALFAVLAGYLLVLTNQITNRQPNQTDVDTQLNSVAKPKKISDTTVNTMKNLEESNVEVKAIFDSARQNPFSE